MTRARANRCGTSTPARSSRQARFPTVWVDSSSSGLCRAQTCLRLVCQNNMHTITIRLIALIMTCAGVTLAAQRGGGPPPGPPNPVEGQPAAIEEGRAIYNKACTTCHGFDGGAGEMGPALGLEGRRFA